jgi:UDP-N-acetylglucosamine--N-acetylmuramyl-(pentapeptide) pyrophosphoryl-undecaprenol N-acetylglucosamine transferase
MDVGAHVQLRHFFDDVPELLAATHLLIARSGASTVAEVATVGRPSILVPYPYATDNHQDANATVLARAGGAWRMPQTEFTPDALAHRLLELTASPRELAAAATAAGTFAVPDAASRLAGVVTGLIRGDNGATKPATETVAKQAPAKRGVA